MKKIVAMGLALMVFGSVAFAQNANLNFSNTVYTGFGTAGINDYFFDSTDNPKVKFEGITDHFTADITYGMVSLDGELAWTFFPKGKLGAEIVALNFNTEINPFTGFDIGLGTNLEWEVGPKPFSGPKFTAYEVPAYAGISVLNYPGIINNTFADRSVAVRYSYDNYFTIGIGLNDGWKDKVTDIKWFPDLGAGIGIKGNILDIFTIGFSYNGSFEEGKNNFYFGSEIFADPVDIGIWVNISDEINDENVTFGTNLEILTKGGGFRFIPEFNMTVWEKANQGVSMHIALITEMSLTDDILLGLNTSWGLGSDFDINTDTLKSGARLNITPHLVCNLNKQHRLAFGANFMPVWWKDGTSTFHWNIPISWTVAF